MIYRIDQRFEPRQHQRGKFFGSAITLAKLGASNLMCCELIEISDGPMYLCCMLAPLERLHRSWACTRMWRATSCPWRPPPRLTSWRRARQRITASRASGLSACTTLRSSFRIRAPARFLPRCRRKASYRHGRGTAPRFETKRMSEIAGCFVH